MLGYYKIVRNVFLILCAHLPQLFLELTASCVDCFQFYNVCYCNILWVQNIGITKAFKK